MTYLRVSIWLLLTACLLGNTDSVLAQKDAGRPFDVNPLGQALQQSKIQSQLRTTHREIETLTTALRSLRSTMDQGVSAEDGKHIQRELMRLEDELAERETQLHALHELQRSQEHRSAKPNSPNPFTQDIHRRPGQARPEFEEPQERLEHMQLAIDHLQASGLHELADQVRQHARNFRHELENREQRRSRDHKQALIERIEVLARELNELREEVSQFRE